MYLLWFGRIGNVTNMLPSIPRANFKMSSPPDGTEPTQSDDLGKPTTQECATSEDQSQTEPLEQFTLFRSLPPELRLKIWGYTLPEAQIIEVLWDEDRGYFTDYVSPVPSALHVCAESRAYALEKYVPMEVDNEAQGESCVLSIAAASRVGLFPFTASDPPPSRPFGVYMDPSRDVLYLSMGNWHRNHPHRNRIVHFLRSLDPKVSSKLERLAIGYYFTSAVIGSRTEPSTTAPSLLEKFPSLKSIAMAVSDSCMSLYTDRPENLAPRRPALAINAIDVSKEFQTRRWCPNTQEIWISSGVSYYIHADHHRIAYWKRLLIEAGVDAGFMNDLVFKITEVGRGEIIN